MTVSRDLSRFVVARHRSGRWTMQCYGGRFSWTGPTSGIAWVVDVELTNDGVPRVSRFSGIPADGGSLSALPPTVLRSMELNAIGVMTREVDRADVGTWFTGPGIMTQRPRSWAHYVRQVMDPGGADRDLGYRAEPVDLRKVAQAVLESQSPASSVPKLRAVKIAAGRLGASDGVASGWIKKATRAGFLAPARSTRSPREPGPLLNAE